MAAYYNENDPFAAAWLRELIRAGHIAPGHVDERSIVDVRGDDLEGYTQCHFFAGIGGWSLALRTAMWPDDRPVWTGSCPCQPFSAAGKRKGFADERHLWPVWRKLIEERRPAVVFGEQVAAAADWLGLVRGDLETMGYAVGAIPIEAAGAGADHLRDRFWFVGHRAQQPEREPHYEGNPFADGGEARPIPSGAGDIGVTVADRAGEQVGTAGQSRQRGDVGDDPRVGRREGQPEHGLQRGRTAAPGDGGSVDLAHAHIPCQGEGRQQRGGEQRGAGGDQEARDVGDGGFAAFGRHGGAVSPTETQGGGARSVDGYQPIGSRPAGFDMAAPHCEGEQRQSLNGEMAGQRGELDWVVGADGKARRVKPGIRLLAHGVPARVAKLRGFGNAIDPRPAAAFIKAFDETVRAAA